MIHKHTIYTQRINNKRIIFAPLSLVQLAFIIFFYLFSYTTFAFTSKAPVRALYIPLADHYAAIIAYERYSESFKYADFSIEQMPNWDFLRAKFHAGDAEMAFIMSPLAMDMFAKKPDFRWIGLMHRDGNALAVNSVLLQKINLPENRAERKPNRELAQALKTAEYKHKEQTLIGMPHLLSTHTVVLYQYLKKHGLTLSLLPNTGADILAISIAPPKSPVFLKSQANRNFSAAFEQSLPWADIVETQGYGKVAWYSKDVIKWPQGHVECITVASDSAIAANPLAIKEVMDAIHIAGRDIEIARLTGGAALNDIVKIIRKHIPAHTEEAIKASLDINLQVINYKNLNIDIEGLQLIMDLAVEGNIIENPININDFADHQFVFDNNSEHNFTTNGGEE